MQFDAGQTQRLTELYPAMDLSALIERVEAFGFSACGYLARNADLVAAGLDENTAAFHYLSQGAVVEQRRFARCEGAQAGAWIEALKMFPLEAPAACRLLANLLFNRYVDDQLTLTREVAGWQAFFAACQDRPVHPVLVIGDSHSEAYMVPRVIGGRVHVPVHLLCSGGSAAGLANPNSKSGYGTDVREILKLWASLVKDFRLPLFFKFGQVDAEFVWVFKRVRCGAIDWSMAEFEAFAEDAVGRYLAFVEQLSDTHDLAGHVRVLSIFPPTLSDTAWQAGYVNAHIGYLESDAALATLSEQVKRISIPTQPERTRLHALWNAIVMRECARRGLLYVDDFQPLIGGQGVVDARYMLGHDGANHHLRFDLLDDVVASIFDRYASVSA